MSWGILWGWALACSTHYSAKGLVFQPTSTLEDKSVPLSLGTSEGDVFRLHLGDDAVYFQHLLGCGAEMTGSRLGRHLWVDSWTITDAGDGSAPFLGVLKEKYGALVLHDINTDTEMELVLSHTDVNLWSYVHQPILVTGIVIGHHQVQVMSVKVLSTESE